MYTGQKRILSFEGGSSRSHYVEASFLRRLWTCRQTNYWVMMMILKVILIYY